MNRVQRILMYSLFFTTAAGCHKSSAQDEEKKRDRVPFAVDRAPNVGGPNQGNPGSLPDPVAFNGERAMEYLKKICAIGPRMSGTKGMRDQRYLIRKHFEDMGLTVDIQPFQAKQISTPDPVEMVNLIVRFFPEQKRRVILCTHYDTRPIADQERDPRKWRETFLSANDGGSGVAFLMELGHHLPQLKTNVGVDFVFFDGEEYIWDKDQDKYFLGSEYFAKTWRAQKRERPEYIGAVLMDMIAGKNARFPMEMNSYRRGNALCTSLWKLAADLKIARFPWETKHDVNDDHIALLNVGIPAVDIIDFDYPHWHRLSDNPDNCSADGLLDVSRLLSVWVQVVK